MDFEYKIYLARAQNELNLSTIILKLSDDKELQVTRFGVKADTYYSAAISHAYYSIFYAAKAYLLTKGIDIMAPEEHRKTLEAFAKLVEQGIIDVELLKVYQSVLTKAEILLHIFETEKGKRTKFTYKRIPQANQEPAQESSHNAQFFYGKIVGLCEKRVQPEEFEDE